MSTVEWLRARTDEELAALLTARGDLLVPAPGDLATLARRIDSAASARRAVAGCTAFDVQLLQAIWVLGDGGARDGMRGGSAARSRKTASGESRGTGRRNPTDGAADPGAIETSDHAAAVSDAVTAERIAAFLGGPAAVVDISGRLAHLSDLGIVRGDPGGYLLAPSVREALGRYPAGLGAPAGSKPAAVQAALDGLGDAERAVLTKLVPGPPVGTISADSPQAPVIAELLRAGLLSRAADGIGGEQTVALPREVALALRGSHPLGPALAHAPDTVITPLRPGSVDGAAGGQLLAAQARAARLLDLLGAEPVPALKAGGIGMTPLRRMAKDLDCEPAVAALYLELVHSSGLIAPAPGQRAAVWLPTQLADTFLAGSETAGWALLADTWWTMRRDPGLVGRRDATGAAIAALGVGAEWRGGPGARRRIFAELAEIGADLAADPAGIAARLAFAAPLHAQPDVAAALAEATELGLVAFGALAATGRALLAGAEPDELAAVAERIVPQPVETFLVQADMTVIAPGRLARHLADALTEIAEVESAGAGTVYRISESSLRRALDAGLTGAEITALLERYSSTELPQSLRYLIDDLAKRHGVLRAGVAESFVHSEDPALVSQAVTAADVAGFALRLLAPTVAVGAVDVETLVETLRAAGLAPAAEDAVGNIVDLRPRPHRTRAAVPSRRTLADPAEPSPEQIAAVVRRVRAGDRRVDTGGEAVETRDIVDMLRQAMREHRAVWIAYADAEGGTSTRIVEPVAVSGGAMIAFDRLRQSARTFTLSRISRAYPDAG